jgi:hypothetical protein
MNSPPPKPEVILTNFFAEPTVLLVPITSRDICPQRFVGNKAEKMVLSISDNGTSGRKLNKEPHLYNSMHIKQDYGQLVKRYNHIMISGIIK